MQQRCYKFLKYTESGLKLNNNLEFFKRNHTYRLKAKNMIFVFKRIGRGLYLRIYFNVCLNAECTTDLKTH